MQCKSVARIHRLGRPGPKRPVILYFQDFAEKQAVLKNCGNLKGTKVNVQNDYSKQTVRRRKLLWDSAKADKAEGRKIFLVHDKLRIDDDMFFWNDATNTREIIINPRSNPELARDGTDSTVTESQQNES